MLTALLVAGCRSEAIPSTPTIDLDKVATIVAATLSAPAPATETIPASATVPAATHTPAATGTPTLILTPTNQTGEVSGSICYRTRDIPAMTAYFQKIENEDTTELSIKSGQSDYSIDLAPGEYIAFAWVADYSLGGLYSEAVPCGMRIDCEDHKAITFEVNAGETLEDIDICDWFAFNVPQPPNKPSEEIHGSISGQINYPGGSPPALHIVALNINTSYWYYVLTLAGATRYTISDLPPGPYQVVAYLRDGSSGGHADVSHNLSPVEVKAGEGSSADITDWSAPAGSFPDDPTEW